MQKAQPVQVMKSGTNLSVYIMPPDPWLKLHSLYENNLKKS